MKIIVAPNAFKEALSAADAAAAIKRGVGRAIPSAEIVELPVADGGDGTAEVLRRALGGEVTKHRVTGPLGEPVRAELTVLEDGGSPIYVIEMSQAAGLSLIPSKKRNPLVTSTEGVGELIDIARSAGAGKIIIGLGGSGTVDGGSGMARALGFSLLDARGKPIPKGGGGLEKLAEIAESQAWPSQPDSGGGTPQIVAACDVTNKLLGRHGAAAVFGPQKGATQAMVNKLERGLGNLAQRIEKDLRRKVRNLEGGGAAGGLGAGLAGFLGAELRPGGELILDMLKFNDALEGADWVITGEGRLDVQTLGGKAPAVVARYAAEKKVPVIALAGQIESDMSGRKKNMFSPFAASFSINRGYAPIENLLPKTAKLLEESAYQVGVLLRGSKASDIIRS